MNPKDLQLLWCFWGGHSLARVAADPDEWIPRYRASARASYSRRERIQRIETERDGIHVTEEGRQRVITWAAIKSHAIDHTPDDVRSLIADFDTEWCRVHALTWPIQGMARDHTESELARIRQCERWMVGLARIVWDPSRTDPEQLDLLDLLEGRPA